VIVARVRRTLLERALLPAHGARVLVACSGGPDSAALLVALARLSGQLGLIVEAASVDHGLRAEAAADVAIAGRQAAALGVPFHPLRVQVEAGGSVQANARAARYAALHGLAQRIGAERIAVGHTQDDQAETVIMRMLRGASVAGLAGIEPLRADGVMRPLIDCRRTDVAAFATQHCEELARDPSNEDLRHERVRVRKQLLPLLELEDASFAQHLADLADDARAASAAISTAAAAWLSEAAPEPGDTIELSSLRRAPEAVRRAGLRLWLARATGHEPGRSHVEQLERAAVAAVEVWLPGGWIVSSDAVRLRLLRPPLSTG
jgi:tRNA(Ile)-lysidine synthase